jgi:L,D-transpeptidase catalytic domain
MRQIPRASTRAGDLLKPSRYARPAPTIRWAVIGIGLSFPSYGIHGTNAPLSIYDFQSRGCIRMHPEDAGALFRQVKVGQRGEIIYEPVLLAQLRTVRSFPKRIASRASSHCNLSVSWPPPITSTSGSIGAKPRK